VFGRSTGLPSRASLAIALRNSNVNNLGAPARLSGISAFDQTFGHLEALENALGGGIVALDLSLPDSRQLSAARSERVRARAHAEPFAELVILVCNRPHDGLVSGGTHGRTGDENGMQANSGQDGSGRGVRK
jgi:hypothetical protein